jgi:hypothetical protein
MGALPEGEVMTYLQKRVSHLENVLQYLNTASDRGTGG